MKPILYGMVVTKVNPQGRQGVDAVCLCVCRTVPLALRISERCSVLPLMTGRWWLATPSDGPPFMEVSEMIHPLPT